MAEDDWHRVCDAEALAIGESREFVVAGRMVALFNVDGEFFALDGICPHQGGPLGQGKLSGCIVTCPWHGWQFDVKTGQHQVNRLLQHVQMPTRIVQGQVEVEITSTF